MSDGPFRWRPLAPGVVADLGGAERPARVVTGSPPADWPAGHVATSAIERPARSASGPATACDRPTRPAPRFEIRSRASSNGGVPVRRVSSAARYCCSDCPAPRLGAATPRGRPRGGPVRERSACSGCASTLRLAQGQPDRHDNRGRAKLAVGAGARTTTFLRTIQLRSTTSFPVALPASMSAWARAMSSSS